eukprot:TRINITY_DN44545_c0_g1_i2.p1 TRINITY_DN44545_c0_g1~~TRINITY_DN44545_c0_g1_i2.p1  ORF type:complete len:102 (-),score=3.13 TRINITY_DN44545_c0_g1_i2:330-635(-)
MPLFHQSSISNFIIQQVFNHFLSHTSQLNEMTCRIKSNNQILKFCNRSLEQQQLTSDTEKRGLSYQNDMVSNSCLHLKSPKVTVQQTSTSCFFSVLFFSFF